MLKDGEKGAVLQRDKESYAIVPHFPLGMISPAELRKLADVAEKYEIAAMKITSASRIAMVGFKEDQIDAAWKDLGITPGAAIGMCIRSIQACPGTTLCRLGKQDSLSLGKEIDDRYHGYKLPNKLKIGISGCINKCTRAEASEIGIHGQINPNSPTREAGYVIYLGGCGGITPRMGFKLDGVFEIEEVLSIIRRVVTFYKENAQSRQRLALLIEKIGKEEFLKRIGLGERKEED